MYIYVVTCSLRNPNDINCCISPLHFSLVRGILSAMVPVAPVEHHVDACQFEE